MKNKTKRSRLALTLLTLFLLVLSAVSVTADEWIDLDAKGSISFTLKDKTKNQPVAGGEISIYKAADVAVDDGDLSFAYTNGFENCGIELGNLSDSTLADKLEAKITSTAAKTTKTVRNDGTVSFTDLPLGLYLCVQTKAADGYNAVSSFLISVPITEEDGTYIYDVNAQPKVKTATPKPTQPPKTPENLPYTGQLDWPVPVLTVMGVLLFALGWSLRRGKQPYGA